IVSKASDDLPEPLSPVMTVSRLRGISTLMFLRLCWRAPRTVILLIDIQGTTDNFCSDKRNENSSGEAGAGQEAPRMISCPLRAGGNRMPDSSDFLQGITLWKPSPKLLPTRKKTTKSSTVSRRRRRCPEPYMEVSVDDLFSGQAVLLKRTSWGECM